MGLNENKHSGLNQLIKTALFLSVLVLSVFISILSVLKNNSTSTSKYCTIPDMKFLIYHVLKYLKTKMFKYQFVLMRNQTLRTCFVAFYQKFYFPFEKHYLISCFLHRKIEVYHLCHRYL